MESEENVPPRLRPNRLAKIFQSKVVVMSFGWIRIREKTRTVG